MSEPQANRPHRKLKDKKVKTAGSKGKLKNSGSKMVDKKTDLREQVPIPRHLPLQNQESLQGMREDLMMYVTNAPNEAQSTDLAVNRSRKRDFTFRWWTGYQMTRLHSSSPLLDLQE
jgi:hypothetical protein